MSRWIWNRSQNALEEAIESHCWTNPPFSATMFFLCHYLHIRSTTKLMFLPSNGIVSSFQSLITLFAFSYCRLFSEVESYVSRAIKEKVLTCFDYISQRIHKKACLLDQYALLITCRLRFPIFVGEQKFSKLRHPSLAYQGFCRNVFFSPPIFFVKDANERLKYIRPEILILSHTVTDLFIL